MVGQIRYFQRGAGDFEAALIEQHPMFEGRVDIERDMRAAVEVDLRTEQRGERVHRRAISGQLAEKDLDRGGADRARLRSVVGEVATGVAVGVGQCHPQLRAVQDGRLRGGDLGVADAGTSRHEVQLAGPDHRVHAGAVAVLHLTAEKPTDGL